MEIKAILNKPYAETQRLEFIIENEQNNPYEVKETETALEAWGLGDVELLEQAKEDKLKKNETIRDEFLISGVIYKGILWDSDIEQKLNISVQVANMSDDDTVVWVAMDGITSLECTRQDLLNIGMLLTQMTAYVWQYKNPEIKVAINNAQTLEELDAIEIVYSLGEINAEPDTIEETEEL